MYTLAPKPDAFSAEELEKLGYKSVRELSDRCGLAPSTLAKFVRGQHPPTAKMIGSLLAETQQPFNKFFRVIPL